MREVKPLPEFVARACEEVLTLFAHDLRYRKDILIEDLSELEEIIHGQSEEETGILDAGVVIVLNAEPQWDESLGFVEFGTGLGGSFFDVPGEGRFSIMNYFDENWRAGGGSSEQPTVVPIEEFIEQMDDAEIDFLDFLGLIKAATSDYDTPLTHAKFIHERLCDWLAAPEPEELGGRL